MGRGASNDNFSVALAQRRTPRRSGLRRPYRWTDDALEIALHEFTAGRKVFPTYAEFDAANRADLRSAVIELGGQDYWAERVGLIIPSGRRRRSYDTASAIHDAKAAMQAAAGRLPGERTLRQMGYGRLATRVRQAGGAQRFAAAHGLQLDSRPETPDGSS